MYRASIIKSIQRYQLVVTNSLSTTQAITAVNTSYTTVNYLGASTTSASSDVKNGLIKLVLTNSTTVTATMDTVNATAITVSMEIVEYYPNILKQAVQRGSITAANGTATAAITAVVRAKAIVVSGGFTAPTDPAQANTYQCYLSIPSTTTVGVTATVAGGFSVAYQVVEFR